MQSDSVPRKYLYILFALSIAGVVMGVVLMGLLAGLDFIGFDGNTQISGLCTGYFAIKYGLAATIESFVFVFSILSLASFLAVLILMVRCFM